MHLYIRLYTLILVLDVVFLYDKKLTYRKIRLSKMEQRERIIKLAKTGMSPQDIEEQLKVEYGTNSYNISTVYKLHSRTITGHTDP